MTRQASAYSTATVRYDTAPGFMRADLRRLTGKKRLETGEIFSAYDAEWVVDIRHRVGEGDRVRDLAPGGLLYRVDNIIRNRRKGMQTLQCSKVNE